MKMSAAISAAIPQNGDRSIIQIPVFSRMMNSTEESPWTTLSILSFFGFLGNVPLRYNRPDLVPHSHSGVYLIVALQTIEHGLVTLAKAQVQL